MAFIKYEKIERLGKEDTEGILEGWCNCTEKIDGANTSIWLDEDDSGVTQVHTGSRNNDITGGSFRGFNEYVANHEGVQRLLKDHPDYHLYGEFLVRHTIHYNESAYNQWYMFDIIDKKGVPFKFEYVEKIAKEYNILTPHNFGDFHNPTVDELISLSGTSKLGDKGEGIVIRNYDYVNKWGRRPYAKIVTESFKEDNGLMFGGNNRHSESYWEVFIVNKYVTLSRVKKIMMKVNSMGDRECDERDTPQIVGMVMNNVITEECWEIFKKVPKVNNRLLKVLFSKRIAQIYKDILHGFESVAYSNEDLINEKIEQEVIENLTRE